MRSIDRTTHRPGNAIVGLPKRPTTQGDCEVTHQVEATIINAYGCTERVRGYATWNVVKQDWDVTLSDGRTMHLDAVQDVV